MLPLLLYNILEEKHQKVLLRIRRPNTSTVEGMDVVFGHSGNVNSIRKDAGIYAKLRLQTKSMMIHINAHIWLALVISHDYNRITSEVRSKYCSPPLNSNTFVVEGVGNNT